MSTFTLHLQDALRYERIDGVSSFVGEDASGSFGVLAGHQRLLTCLVFGLARFRVGEAPWQYLAVPGAVLYFIDNALYVSTRRYLRDPDYGAISQALQEQLVAEEAELRATRESLRRMEEEVLHRIWQLGQSELPP